MAGHASVFISYGLIPWQQTGGFLPKRVDMWVVSLTALFVGFLLGLVLMAFLVGASGLGS